jgi:hypothetical protein
MDKQSVPYTLDEMRRFYSMCDMTTHDPELCQYLGPFNESHTDKNPGADECLDCSTNSEITGMFDYCGICKFIATGKGVVEVPENNLLYNIKEAPYQLNPHTWILIANNDALEGTIDDHDWALIFDEEDRCWHNFGLIKLPDKNKCPECDCQYAYEYDRTESSTPYECFNCGTRFSF